MGVSAVKCLLKVMVVCVVCVVCGCVSPPYYQLYTGQQRSSDDVAVLYIGGGLRIQNVNENTPGYLRLGQVGSAWRYPDVLELLPGAYRITASYAKGSFLVSQPETVVTLRAKAGHSYIVGAVVYVRNAQVKAWRAVIVDKGLGYDEGVSPEPVYLELSR
jgi:hypothetical protein